MIDADNKSLLLVTLIHILKKATCFKLNEYVSYDRSICQLIYVIKAVYVSK